MPRPILAGAAVLWAAVAAPAFAGPPDPCALLADEELLAVQGHAPARRVASEQRAGPLRVVHCFFATPEPTRSVSLALGLPAAGTSGPRDYWGRHVRAAADAAPKSRKKQPPQRLTGLGEEAFWVGNAFSGALYVLQGDVFLRVSPGGAPDAAVRLERARELAARALARLAAGS